MVAKLFRYERVLQPSHSMQHFFILGNHPRLSQAELTAVLPHTTLDVGFCPTSQSPMPQFYRGAPQKPFDFANDAFVLASTAIEDYKELHRRIGGTIKIGDIARELDEKNIARDCAALLLENNPSNKKIFFGISVYGCHVSTKNLAFEIKKILEEKGTSSRWVESQGAVLSSIVVQTNKLLWPRG